MTLSTRYFVEACKTKPERRLMAMSTNPSASNPLRGFISAQTSGRFFHAFLRFSLLTGDLAAVSVAMIRGTTLALPIRCSRCPNNYMARQNGTGELRKYSVASGSRARHAGPGRAIEVQDAGDKFAAGN